MVTKSTLSLGLFILLGTSVQAQTRSLISLNIDNSVRAQIPHSTHMLVPMAEDQGRVEGSLEMSRMILVLSAPTEADSQLREFLDSQQTLGSPNYHKWLDPDEFGRNFGPSPGDVQTVREWLENEGFKVDSVARSGSWMEFSGMSSQVENAFGTQMHRYMFDGQSHVANATDISIPAALAPVVRGVVSLNDFFEGSKQLRPFPDVNLTGSNGTIHTVGPGDFAKIFNLGPLYDNNLNGSGIIIGVVGVSNIHMSDVQSFRTIFNLPTNNPNVILNGPDPGFLYSSTNEDAAEATLDVEWSGAVAPNATIDLVVSAGTGISDAVELSAAYIVDNNLADILSQSFQRCETPGASAEDIFYLNLWQQAAAQGISVFVSAGDSGADTCQNFRQTSGPAAGPVSVNGDASPPFATAVGGTQFDENGSDSVFWAPNSGPQFTSALGYIPEVVWNVSCDPTVSTCPNNEYDLVAGGGGESVLYPKPSWQSLSLTGMPNDHVRDVPDVSLPAAKHDGYVGCFSGEPTNACIYEESGGTVTSFSNPAVFSGTSASAPAFAGIMAIVDQKTDGRQGLANYVLYQLAAGENYPNCDSGAMTNPAIVPNCIFNDITQGNNSIPGVKGYSATTGYDLASGLGSVNAANLVNAWASAAKSFQGSQTSLVASVDGTSVTSIALEHGQTISVSGAVKAISGNGVPTGAVAFIASQYTAAAYNQMASATLSKGTYQSSLASLPGGQYNVVAHYPGDGTYASSDSNSIPVTVTPEDSSTTLSAIMSASPYSLGLAVLATVAGASKQGTPTGYVNFADAGIPIASMALNSGGQAQLPSCGSGPPGVCVAVGTHTITASYSGDNSFAPSKASPLTVTVQPFLLSTPNSWAYIAAGSKTASYSLTLRANYGFSGVVSLACSGLPNNVSCMVTPTKVNLSSSPSSSVSVSVSLLSNQGFVLPTNPHVMSSQMTWPISFLCILLTMSLWKRCRLCLAVLIVSLSILALSACNTHTTTTNVATFNVTGSSGTTTVSVPLTLTITE
jgi:subtilase family serine protease